MHLFQLWVYTISCVFHALTWGNNLIIEQPYTAAALLCSFAFGNPAILTALSQLIWDMNLLLLHLVILLFHISVLFIDLIKLTLRIISYIISSTRSAVKEARTGLSLRAAYDTLSLTNIHWSKLWDYTNPCGPHALAWAINLIIEKPYIIPALLWIFALTKPEILTVLFQLIGDMFRASFQLIRDTFLLMLHLVILLFNILVQFIKLTPRIIYFALRTILYIIGFPRRDVERASIA